MPTLNQPMKRTFIDYFLIALKGICMGAADVVPGVSGGTIAFISGIYEELLETIDGFKLSFFRVLKQEGLKSAWQSVNANFLAALFVGIFISILTFAKLISWLLETRPILLWSFFFGLIVASVFFVGKQISKWSPGVLLALLAGTIISFYITIAQPMAETDSYLFLFIAGFVAIIAMILPGISGAFILVLMGAYQGVLNTVNNFREGVAQGDWALFSTSFGKLAMLMLGAIIGLKTFSGALTWMFKHHKNLTLSLLTGFMIGSLNKIWPWKHVLTWRTNPEGIRLPLIEKNISPFAFEGDNHLVYAIILSFAGFFLILGLEKIASKKA